MNIIVLARKKWIESINTKNIYNIMECYNIKHIFKGTMNHKVTDRKNDTRRYFEKFLKNNPKVIFTRSDIIQMNDTYIDYGTYSFQTKNDGFISANYQFIYKIVDDKPKIISHFSSKI